MAARPASRQVMFARLQHRLVGGTPLKSRTVAGAMGESFVADGLARLQARFPEVEIGSYPFNRNGVFGTRLVLRATADDRLAAAAGELDSLLAGLVAQGVWATAPEAMEPPAVDPQHSGPGAKKTVQR